MISYEMDSFVFVSGLTSEEPEINLWQKYQTNVPITHNGSFTYLQKYWTLWNGYFIETFNL